MQSSSGPSKMSFPKFLVRREKQSKSKSRTSSVNRSHSPKGTYLPSRCWKIFSDVSVDPAGAKFLGNRNLQQQVKDLKRRLEEADLFDPGEQVLRYVLLSKYARGDTEKALELLLIIQNSIEGVIERSSPTRKLRGAENRGKVTCYLDSLLFAMFARHKFFDAILYPTYDDESRQNLIVLIRLWVNMLRLGKLIPTDITMLLQNALAQCGWPEAAQQIQQDVSEAFTFIADKLDLPLVTLKMDLFHGGKEDIGGDHKFVNERLLEVAIPPDPGNGEPILLEDCLELYFNNRIDVRRYLERQDSLHTDGSYSSKTKCQDSEVNGCASHIETICPDPSANSLGSDRTLLDSPSEMKDCDSICANKAPLQGRTSSIVRSRFVPDSDDGDNIPDGKTHQTRTRKGNIRKEVMVPAWAMFSLIPWYTQNNATVFQTAMHFSEQRPILGICLKRYSFLPSGEAVRLNTKIDIPTEIALPHFIKDDDLTDEAPLYGKFKIVLQSVVCHQGTSIHSGHYIALVRGTPRPAVAMSDGDSSASSNAASDKANSHWLRFDDLAKERITLVDIDEALMSETPYLLFYQIMPLDEDPDEGDPPAYTEPDPSTTSLLATSSITKIASDVLGYESNNASLLDVNKSAQSRRAASTDGRPSAADAESQLPPLNSGSFMRGIPRITRASSSENLLNTARTYFSRKRSMEPVGDGKDVSEPGSNRTSLDLRRGRKKDKSSRSQSLERSGGSNLSRSRTFQKNSGKNRPPPERECIVM
ncbi:hypothetical protein VTO42DRAFT_832 [Malbranchea cinnamomea]